MAIPKEILSVERPKGTVVTEVWGFLCEFTQEV